MSDLNLNSPTGIIYIVLIIVACLVGLWALKKLFPSNSSKTRTDGRNRDADLIEERNNTDGGKRHRVKRQRK